MNVQAEQVAFAAWIATRHPSEAVIWDTTRWYHHGEAVIWDATRLSDGTAGLPVPREVWMRDYWTGWLARAS
jgi:hypothetical protein